MMIVHLLGTGSANAGPSRTTTMLAIEHHHRTVLIDCGGDAARRLQLAGLDPAALDAIILTHEHPDHIAGYPLLLEKLWLMGRKDPIPIYGPAPTLEKAHRLFTTFNTENWHGFPGRLRHEVKMETGALVFDLDGLTVTATPVDHPVPTIGLRFETDEATVAYSCDTAPTEAVVELAKGAQVLIHEGTGSLQGVHSSPEEAAHIAAEAGVERLILVHAPLETGEASLEEARAIFPETSWGHDGDRIDL